MTNTQSPNILIVEDSPVMSLILQKHLQSILKCNILAASTISDAKTHLFEIDIHIIISDIMLPGGENGIDFLKYIRKDQRFHKIKFYVITAHNDLSIRTEAYKLNCDGFLYKPFTRDQLREMLNYE